MKNYRMVVNLVGGGSVAGKATEMTEEVFQGSWAIFPRVSVLYVELEVVE